MRDEKELKLNIFFRLISGILLRLRPDVDISIYCCTIKSAAYDTGKYEIKNFLDEEAKKREA